VSKAIKVRARWVLGGWRYGQHRLALAIGAQAPSAAKYTLAVLPQDWEAFRISAEPIRLLQRPHSAITPGVRYRTNCAILRLFTDCSLEQTG
jgi:hypothetical protein